MPLDKEFSLVADSTISSSPEPPTDASTTHIQRAVKTYGRRHEASLEEAPTASLYAKRHFTHSDSILNTAPPGLKDTVPPSPGGVNIVQDNSDNESTTALRPPTFGKRQVLEKKDMDIGDDISHYRPGSSTSKFNFGWKQRLNLIDEEFDLGEVDSYISNVAGPKTTDEPRETLFGDAIWLQERADDVVCESKKDIQSSKASTISDDVFTCTYPSQSRAIVDESSFVLSSPLVATRVTRNRSGRVLRDSESEEEGPRDSSSTAPSTAGHPPLSSPMPRSPSTQPTSDDEELPSTVILKPKKANGRQPTKPRETVPSLGFSKLYSNDEKKGKAGKKGKIKVVLTSIG